MRWFYLNAHLQKNFLIIRILNLLKKELMSALTQYFSDFFFSFECVLLVQCLMRELFYK